MTKKEFIFTKGFPQRLYRHITFWVIYYIFSLLTYFHPFLEKTTFQKWVIIEVVEVFSHVTLQIIFCYTVIYVLLPRFFRHKKYFSFTACLIFTSFAVSWCAYYAASILFRRLHVHAGVPFMAPILLYWYTFISFSSYYPISTGLAIAFKTLKDFYTKQEENQVLTRENANAELQLLKAQIHPHFLFNTLNNIYSFTLDKSMQAPKLVKNLSDTLRYMITDCDAEMVPLTKELKMLNDYIDLEKVRYGDRLDIKIDVTGDTTNKVITPLLMIPFVENSFKHGASQLLRECWITIFMQVDDSLLHFTLENSKPPGESERVKGGIGLSNVKKRLQLLYPSEHLLTIESTAHTFSINMQIPLRNNE